MKILQDFQISTKISARFPDSSADFDIHGSEFQDDVIIYCIHAV